jgi:pyruvate dehydrogenase E2 component (dihydrolipoyllysine-residue acetyltransferase)
MAQIVSMPKLGFDMAEGTLVRWVANEGENITKGAVLAEIETDKATVEVESTYSGVLLRQLVQQGAIVPVNDPIAVIGAPGEEVEVETLVRKMAEGEKKVDQVTLVESSSLETSVHNPTPATEAAPLTGWAVLASPLARSMAEELGIDLHQVRGTGPGGRITKKDIESYKVSVPSLSPSATSSTISTTPFMPPVQTIRETQRIPLPKLRAAIGRRMGESMQQAPHFYVTHEYDVASLLDLRRVINALLPEDDKLSVNDFIVRAVALTLLEYPNLNASLDLRNNVLIYHGDINIGVAVAVENGLLTVVSRNSDRKTVHQISSELKAMVIRARDMKVRPEDIEGSTFTVSNMGMYQVDQFTAIINPPEAAILAIGSARQVPVVVDGELKVGERMKTTLSIDHRISDGAEGARFLQTLAKYIEEPLRLMI